MANEVEKIQTHDGVELDLSKVLGIDGIKAILTITSKGNTQLSSAEGAKINIESGDNIAFKPVGKIQLDVNHFVDDADKDEFEISVINDKAAKVQGLKIETAGLKFVNGKADTSMNWDPNKFPIQFKKTTGDVDTWTKVNIHAAAIDLRARTTGAGTGGGVAIQIAGEDSSHNENKFKIETSRTVDVDVLAQPSDYVEEGGKGIEIGTINSQFTSLYTKTYRYKHDAPIYGVTRGSVVNDGDKTDYPTQDDDSKDIINTEQLEDPLTLDKLYKMYKYLKAENPSIFTD